MKEPTKNNPVPATVLQQQIMRDPEHTCLRAVLLDMKGFDLCSWGKPAWPGHLFACMHSPRQSDADAPCRPLVIP